MSWMLLSNSRQFLKLPGYLSIAYLFLQGNEQIPLSGVEFTISCSNFFKKKRKEKTKVKPHLPGWAVEAQFSSNSHSFPQCAPALWEVHWLCYDSCHHCAEGKLDNPLTEVVRMSLQISGLKYLTEFFPNNTKEMNSRIWEIESTKRKMLFFSCSMSSMWKNIFYLVSSF